MADSTLTRDILESDGEKESWNCLQYSVVSLCISFYFWHRVNLLLSNGLCSFSGFWLFGGGKYSMKITLLPGQSLKRSQTKQWISLSKGLLLILKYQSRVISWQREQPVAT